MNIISIHNNNLGAFPPFIGKVQTFLKLNSRPQHPLSGRYVTLVTEREGWGLILNNSNFQIIIFIKTNLNGLIISLRESPHPNF